MPEEIEHLVPAGMTVGPVDVSIVVPSLNEEITVGEFVDWCKEGLERAGVRGQILIIDSSTDKTPEIVLQHGGEVLRTPKRGLGRAYIDAASYIRGQWIIMGDADLTYDFRELLPFVEAFRNGAEFVMGSRLRGSIEQGAMPGLHRYFGTPLTTWVLNRIYGSRYSDIHCGMRGLTRSAFDRIDLKSQSWEYASEMVLKAARFKHGLRPRSLNKLHRVLSYDRGMFLSASAVFVGIVLLGILVYQYLTSKFRLFEISHPAIFGLLLIIVGFQTFCFTLLLEMAQRVAPEHRL